MDDLLYQIITRCTNWTAIIAAENGKRPKKPFLSIESRTAKALPSQLGDIESDGVDGFKRAVSALRDLNVSLMAYGDNGIAELNIIAQQLQTESMGDFCAANNVAVVEIESLQQIPELQSDMTYEPRAVLEFRFRYAVSVNERMDVIEQVLGSITDQISGETDEFISTVILNNR